MTQTCDDGNGEWLYGCEDHVPVIPTELFTGKVTVAGIHYYSDS